MMRALSAVLLGAVALMQSGTAQGPTFRSRTDLVSVDVAVNPTSIRSGPVVVTDGAVMELELGLACPPATSTGLA